ncbi:MAG: hypothetical protein RLZZ269_602 [Actinomycetota bacterium]|jgi:hypothetical protein
MRISRFVSVLAQLAGVAIVVMAPSQVSAAPAQCGLWNGATLRYEIDDEGDLDTLRSNALCLTQTLFQTADIDLAADLNTAWTPISNFAGNYNGNGKSITGLKLSGNNSGLFNTTTSAVSITDLNVVVDPTSNAGDQVGALVGEASGPVTITGVGVQANFTGGNNVGGFIGRTESIVTISASSIAGTISGSFIAGGMIGRTDSGTSNTVVISNSSSTANISVTGSFAGGFVGVGLNTDVTITNSDADGNISAGVDYAGGFNGGSRNLTVIDSGARGNVSALSPLWGAAGGFSSGQQADVTIVRSYWSGIVSSAGSFSAGFVTDANVTTISESYCLGQISSGNGISGGFVGWASDLSIDQSFSDCDVTVAGSQAGGLFSQASGNASVTNSYVSGDVNATSFLGGLGWSVLGNSAISNSYVTGSVTGAAPRGKFTAQVTGTSTVSNSFCLLDVCADPNLVTAEQLGSRTFLGSRSWDVASVWCVNPLVNSGRPFLRATLFGPFATLLGTTGCASDPARSVPQLHWLTIEPGEGTCILDSEVVTTSARTPFLGYRYVPGAAECARIGFVFSGWASRAEPSRQLNLPLLYELEDGVWRYFIADSRDLVALWRQAP